MRHFTEKAGLRPSIFGEHRGLRAVHYPVQLHQRRAPNAERIILKNHKRLLNLPIGNIFRVLRFPTTGQFAKAGLI